MGLVPVRGEHHAGSALGEHPTEGIGARPVMSPDATVGKVEEPTVADAEGGKRGPGLAATDVGGLDRVTIRNAAFAGRHPHDGDRVAPFGVEGQRPPAPERFVVGMGCDRHDARSARPPHLTTSSKIDR